MFVAPLVIPCSVIYIKILSECVKIETVWITDVHTFSVCETLMTNFDVLLTVHLSITLVNDQLDAQFFYFIIRLLQSSTCLEQRRAHHQEVKLY